MKKRLMLTGLCMASLFGVAKADKVVYGKRTETFSNDGTPGKVIVTVTCEGTDGICYKTASQKVSLPNGPGGTGTGRIFSFDKSIETVLMNITTGIFINVKPLN